MKINVINSNNINNIILYNDSTLSNILVNPKYPNANNELIKTSPLILKFPSELNTDGKYFKIYFRVIGS